MGYFKNQLEMGRYGMKPGIKDVAVAEFLPHGIQGIIIEDASTKARKVTVHYGRIRC